MVAKRAVRMIQKYFNIRREDHAKARGEVSAPNVAKFFAKHVASASLGGFCEVSFIEEAFALLRFIHFLHAAHTFGSISLAGLVRFVSRVWESPAHVVVTARNAQPLGTRVFGAESNTQCVFPSLLEVGCRNQSLITHEVSSTEAFSDYPVFARLGVLVGEERTPLAHTFGADSHSAFPAAPYVQLPSIRFVILCEVVPDNHTRVFWHGPPIFLIEIGNRRPTLQELALHWRRGSWRRRWLWNLWPDDVRR